MSVLTLGYFFLTSLNLSFLICKMGIIIHLCYSFVVKIKLDNVQKAFTLVPSTAYMLNKSMARHQIQCYFSSSDPSEIF